mmetsp:Transcript_1976/g.6929  ORF Transcript_1976/g.6929 Transcript_1976/m.6929 type:complete len:257 (+) Transcript_1976:2-772(+)
MGGGVRGGAGHPALPQPQQRGVHGRAQHHGAVEARRAHVPGPGRQPHGGGGAGQPLRPHQHTDPRLERQQDRREAAEEGLGASAAPQAPRPLRQRPQGPPPGCSGRPPGPRGALPRREGHRERQPLLGPHPRRVAQPLQAPQAEPERQQQGGRDHPALAGGPARARGARARQPRAGRYDPGEPRRVHGFAHPRRRREQVRGHHTGGVRAHDGAARAEPGAQRPGGHRPAGARGDARPARAAAGRQQAGGPDPPRAR